ncbi:MAG: hypothetical protein R3320_11770 [Nitriliruptorales bacterium]|nr:hypothetical protein [Nitriliruptorales bacterium]
MATGTLDLNQVDAERKRQESAEAQARRIVEEVLADAQNAVAGHLEQAPTRDDSADDGSWEVAHRIVEEVLATEAALDTTLDERALDEPDSSTVESSRTPVSTRRHLVLLNTDQPLVLVPGPVYEPGAGSWIPSGDRLGRLVDDVLATLRTAPKNVGAVLREAADSPGMPATRWMLLGLLWMAAFAALVPFAFATIGNSLQMEIDLYGEDTATQPAAEQPAGEQPTDVTGQDNPSVEGSGS